MDEWIKIHGKKDGRLTDRYVGYVEIRYRDQYNVTRTARGLNFPPFGVSVDGVDGSKLPGAKCNVWGETLKYIPHERILYWRAVKTQ